MNWNDIDTGKYEGMIAETVVIEGFGGDRIPAYYSRPLGEGPYPGIVLIPHMPGWDEMIRETCRRFTQHGYAVIAPDIYARVGKGRPDEVAKKSREAGGVKDRSVMGDTSGSLDYLRSQLNSNGKAGVIGMCSGGRHAFLAACELEGIDAAVDCWGGGVFAEVEDEHGEIYRAVDSADGLNCPLLGIFGNDDQHPDPEDVNELERILKEKGKDYTFYRYNGAGHGIWYYDKPMYRQAQAMDSWEKVLDFFGEWLKTQ